METRSSRSKLDKWRNDLGGKSVVDFPLEKNLVIRLWVDSLISHYIYSGSFELEERELVKKLLRPGDTFVDVGANIGLFSLIASRIVGNMGSVHAFEPAQVTYRRLTENIQLNDMTNVTCHKIALSSENGTAKFNVSLEGYDGWNSLATPSKGDNFEVEEVDVFCWDDFAQKQNLQGCVTLMKIDVEGWETQMLKGASKEFLRPDAPVLLVEFADETAQSAGTSCRELYQTIEGFGYKLYSWTSATQTLSPAPMLEHYTYANLLAIKNVAAVRTRLFEQVN